jgi:hypothetical protein
MKARRQQGSVYVLTAITLPIVIGFCGLGVELSIAFQRQAQLQQLADAAALSAATRLDGTTGGVSAAYTRAASSIANRPVRGVDNVILPTAALSFASDPSAANWLDYDAARAAPAGLYYVRADLSALDTSFTTLPLFFGAFLGGGASATVGARAVAGPNGVRVLPLAICALSNTAVGTRANGTGMNERIEYGFRFGLTYNLLALNPAAGAASGEFFLIDPVSPPGSTALAASTDDSLLAPFMCTGKLAYPSLSGQLNLRRNASFGLWRELNSRFNDYGGAACDPYAAPPDTNVREFVGSQANWMSSVPPQASAASTAPEAGKPLTTIADRAYPLPAAAPAQYGTLWAYGPAKRSATTSFSTAQWGSLYPSAPAFSATGTTWPGSPYAAFIDPPAGNPGRKERRLLYVPLLACPVAAGSHVTGTVLAVARFLLTAKASAAEVPGEFAGILGAPELAGLATDVELLQ